MSIRQEKRLNDLEAALQDLQARVEALESKKRPGRPPRAAAAQESDKPDDGRR